MKKGRFLWLVLFIACAGILLNAMQVSADTDTKQETEQKGSRNP